MIKKLARYILRDEIKVMQNKIDYYKSYHDELYAVTIADSLETKCFAALGKSNAESTARVLKSFVKYPDSVSIGKWRPFHATPNDLKMR